MEYTPFESSMIDLVGYDKDYKILEVHFVNTGYMYAYDGVSLKEYKALLKASSKGGYMRVNGLVNQAVENLCQMNTAYEKGTII